MAQKKKFFSEHAPPKIRLPSLIDLQSIISVEDSHEEYGGIRSLLQKFYLEHGQSFSEIALRFGVKESVIRYWCQLYAIDEQPDNAKSQEGNSDSDDVIPQVQTEKLPTLRSSAIGHVAHAITNLWYKHQSWSKVAEELKATTEELRIWVKSHLASMTYLRSSYLKLLLNGIDTNPEPTLATKQAPEETTDISPDVLERRKCIPLPQEAEDRIIQLCGELNCNEKQLFLQDYDPSWLTELANRFKVNSNVYLRLVRYYNSGELPVKPTTIEAH